MKIEDVKKRAKALKIDATTMSKGEAIRAIQATEGNFPCFETAGDYCDQLDCCWRKDCVAW
jgi:hypothetical protein